MSASTYSNPRAGVIASATDIYTPAKHCRRVEFNALPGIIIFVHGVNSMGEWYAASEEGLCKGLNQRLRRTSADPDDCWDVGGLLQAAEYSPELTPQGYLTRVGADAFVSREENSPVIRFRWGYAAAKADLKNVGPDILLDENNAWGGGPFANGCSALPDLWSNGTITDIFAGLQVEYLNTETSRLVYNCPARHYGAHAAWRLAALVAQIRQKHEEENGKACPVTVVCHSQGNMVGMASAFIGKHKLGGKGVADTYVLANPPYSVLASAADNFVQFDAENDLGRVTVHARRQTLDKFFEIVGKQECNHASPACVNGLMSNVKARPPWDAVEDRAQYPTQKRVFLYANPHDQVISVSTVLGLGWLGLSPEVLAGTDDDMKSAAGTRGEPPFAFSHAEGVLFQRIWAQGDPKKPAFKVGDKPGVFCYYNQGIPGAASPIHGAGRFWFRKPLALRFHVRRVWDDERKSLGGKIGATIVGGLYQMTFGAVHLLTMGKYGFIPVNADPPKGWKVIVNAPAVPNPIEPRTIRLYHAQEDPTGQQPADDGQVPKAGTVSGVFNQGPESHTDALNPAGRSNDVYDAYREKGQGDAAYESEAALRYEHNAGVRQLARRKAGDPHEEAVAQMHKDGDLSDARFEAFREFDAEKRKYFLREARDLNATNHSTILTNAEHSERVLAYDVNVGVCMMPAEQMNWLRRFADWRYCDSKNKDMREWSWYYGTGRIEGDRLEDLGNYKPDVPKAIDIDTERADTKFSQTPAKYHVQRPTEHDPIFGRKGQ